MSARPYTNSRCAESATGYEKHFIDGLGRWKRLDRPTRGNDIRRRKLCLLGYRNSIRERKVWDGINRVEVILHLNNILTASGIKTITIPMEEILDDATRPFRDKVSDPLPTDRVQHEEIMGPTQGEN